MAAKDAQAREKAQEVEKRVGPIVVRTGTLESQVASLQSQVASLNSQVASLNSQVATLSGKAAAMGRLNSMGTQTIGSGAPSATQSSTSGAFANTATHINAILNCW